MLTLLGKAIGLGLGTGFSPVAPGTVGSLAAVAIYYVIAVLAGLPALYVLAGLIIGGAAIGVWATGLLSTTDQPDPGKAVWDEFVGMWLTCVFLPTTIPWLIAAFLAFRFFDIVKPWPARRLEAWRGGWGIMADDVVAGTYGAVLLNAAHLARSFLPTA